MDYMDYIEEFQNIIHHQMKRTENCMAAPTFPAPQRIGLLPGDGIGPLLMAEAKRVLEVILKEEIEKDEIRLEVIQGLEIERRLQEMETLPKDVSDKIRKCPYILKGPTETPTGTLKGINLESANVALRRELSLFACIRPISIPEKNIEWIFFRENTEGEYALGNCGIAVSEDLVIDFKVTTRAATEKIARAAFDYARESKKNLVTVVTKANIMKKTDGMFLDICLEIAKEYPEIKVESVFVDIMAANLINQDLASKYQVILLPNLYGDILTDLAAQIQGGVGTAASINLGEHYALFEAVHGTAPDLIEKGLAQYANPKSILSATAMMLAYMGHIDKKKRLDTSLRRADKLKRQDTTMTEYTDIVINDLQQEV